MSYSIELTADAQRSLLRLSKPQRRFIRTTLNAWLGADPISHTVPTNRAWPKGRMLETSQRVDESTPAGNVEFLHVYTLELGVDEEEERVLVGSIGVTTYRTDPDGFTRPC